MSGAKTLPELYRDVVHAAHSLSDRGFCPAMTGNLSVLTADGRILVTPAGRSLADVREGDLVLTDRQGRRLSGNFEPPVEIGMHVAVYRGRTDVRAVIHCHPPLLTGFAVRETPIVSRTMPEFLLETGGTIPVVPFGLPGTEALSGHLMPFVEEFDVVLLAHHGVLAWGESLADARSLVEHGEFAAGILSKTGAAAELPESIISAVMDMRTRLGKGPSGRIRAASRLQI